jgi:benzodiazapine receptor
MITAWLAIAVICFVIGFALNRVFPADYKWFMRLRRPRWLTFEGAIPFIWISIFICGITSAAVIWEVQPATFSTWLLMTGYAIVEIAVLAYTPVMTRLRNVRVGAISFNGSGLASFGLGRMAPCAIFAVESCRYLCNMGDGKA